MGQMNSSKRVSVRRGPLSSLSVPILLVAISSPGVALLSRLQKVKK